MEDVFWSLQQYSEPHQKVYVHGIYLSIYLQEERGLYACVLVPTLSKQVSGVCHVTNITSFRLSPFCMKPLSSKVYYETHALPSRWCEKYQSYAVKQ